VFAILTLFHSSTVNSHAGVGLKGSNRTVDFVTPGTEELSIEVSMFVNVRSADKWRKNNTSSRIDSKDCRHEFISNDGKVLVDYCKTPV
jgi:hypothetical protein